MLHEPLEVINRRLEDTYGLNIYNKAKYRIVKADEQFEQRFGRYKDFSDHGENILLRDVEEVREVYKYPAFLGFLVLEKAVDVPTEMWEIKNHNKYEMLWVFRDREGQPQELYWRAIKFLVDSNVKNYRQSMAEFMEEVKKVERDEMEYFMDYLSNEAPAFDGLLRDGEAVVKTVNTRNGEVVK